MSKKITLELLQVLENQHRETMNSKAPADSDAYHFAQDECERIRKARDWVNAQPAEPEPPKRGE